MAVNTLLKELADIGWRGSESDEGRDCLGFTENEDQVHRLLVRKVEDLAQRALEKGLWVDVEEDAFGNTYITLEGESDRKIGICSHLDSVFNGGRYDGIMGVAAGFEVLERFVEAGEKPRKTLELFAFRSEESSASGKGLLGSALATGNFDIDVLKKLRHRVLGKSIYDVLLDRGLSDKRIEDLMEDPFLDGGDLDAVLELHCEQSAVLGTVDRPFAVVVQGIGGARRSDVVFGGGLEGVEEEFDNVIRVRIIGKAAHSGGTPMNGENIRGEEVSLRRDALLGMVHFLKRIEGDGKLLKISVPGGAYNKVPGECVVEIGLRDGEAMDLFHDLDSFDSDGLEIEFEILSEGPVVGRIRSETVNAAFRMIDMYEDVGQDCEGSGRATIGNVVCDENRIILHTDQRYVDANVAEWLRDEIMDEMRGYHLAETVLSATSPTPFVGGIQGVMREVYQRIYQEAAVELVSMPQHDVANLIRSRRDGVLVPGGMIFVRGLNEGISHHPDEFCAPEDVEEATTFLYETVKALMA